MTTVRVALALTALAASMALGVPAQADEPVPVPTLTAPPAGLRGFALWDSYSDLAPLGYEEQEYLVSGTATDAGGTPAPYTTRIIVTRPVEASDFNGTVLLDWVNVTAQFENAVDSLEARPMLLREGYAFVHVSVQAAGLCCSPLTPKVWDPVRYAAISHPGDDWAFDIFTQVAQAFRSPPGELDPMGDLGVGSVARVLVAGQSQSALRLRDYLDQWLPSHPSAVGVVDGVLLHGDVGAAKPFARPLPIKVLHLLSDLEAADDGIDPATVDPAYRLWEVAGTGHSDLFIGHQSIAGHGPRVLAAAQKQTPAQYAVTFEAAGSYGERIDPELLVCTAAGAAMPMRYAVSSALHQLRRWVDGGPAPANGPRFTFADGTQAQDELGNALGGIRLPPIDVPVARYRSTACQLGGITIPFTDVELVGRYGTHADYYDQMARATDVSVADGWVLPEDAVDLMARACAARVRFPDGDRSCPAYEPPPYDVPLSLAAPSATAPDPSVAGDRPGAADTGPSHPLPATGATMPVVAAFGVLAAALSLLGLLRGAGVRASRR